MNVVIVGNFWFPRGTASAARVRNLASGLRDCGAQVHVMTMAPHPRLEGAGPRGDHEGISYECVAPLEAAVDGWRDAARSVPRLRRRLRDRILWFGGLYGSTPIAHRRLRQRIERGQCDLVVAYDRSALRMTPLAALCRARGVTSVLDVVEISEQIRGGRMSALYWDSRIGTRTAPRLFDGLTVISAGLAAAYRAAGCLRTLVVPAIEDWPAFAPPAPTGNRTFRLAYVGALQPRDAPEMLLETMRILAARGRPVALDVIGHYEGTEGGRRFLRQCEADPLLRSAVSFRGTLSDAALEERLQRSDGLVLTRRDAPTETMSFPTRLVEYLQKGRPVFVSNVGDVGLYLCGGEEVVLLHPQDPAKAAAAITEVSSRPDRGAELGRRGREAGSRAFDRKRHAARLLEFAEGMRTRGRS
jgi:glycosyltransferase involved in cell wall biosynthesis